MTTPTIVAGGQPITLLAERAAFLASSRTLLVADAHIGKSTTFRALGVPVPHGTTGETLASLSRLIAGTGACRVVLLGDFLHSAKSQTPAVLGALARWRRLHDGIELVLVRGNHDARAGDPPPYLRIDVVAEPYASARDPGLAFSHHPRPTSGAYVLAGHLHPCVGVSGRAWQRLRLPCFWFGDDVGVLPAFGAFTGTHPVERAGANDRLFAVADDAVTEVPVAWRGAKAA